MFILLWRCGEIDCFRPKAVLLLCLGDPNQETYIYSVALCFIPRYDAMRRPEPSRNVLIAQPSTV